MVSALVTTLAVDGARAHDEQRDAVSHCELRCAPGAVDVDPVVPVDLVHRLPGAGLGREVHQRLDPSHLGGGGGPGGPIGDVTDDHRPREGVAGAVWVGVDLGVEQVEGRDVVPHLGEPAREVLADEAGTPGDQHGHAPSPVAMTRAGTPPTVAPGGTLRVTTAPAPTVAPSPMVTPPRTTARWPTNTRSPMTTGPVPRTAARSARPWSLVATNTPSASTTSSPIRMGSMACTCTS